MSNEIGGYFELEHFTGSIMHGDLIALNSGRGCISYLVELRGIKGVWLPDWMCDSVSRRFLQEGVDVKTYRIDRDFLPVYDFTVADDEWLFLMDYYGQLNYENVEVARSRAKGKLIVDETQGYFRDPWKGCDTTYTCRKWFGVSDGAFVSTSDGARLGRELSVDESYRRAGFVLGRFERPAGEFFEQSQNNNDYFDNEPAKKMSALTRNLLRAVDYESAKARRERNWRRLDDAFSGVNGLSLRRPDGPFMYPLLVKNGTDVKRFLIENKVFVPTLWPNVLTEAVEESWAWKYTRDIVPLPIDQRYDERDMDKIISIVRMTGVSVG